MDVLSCVFVSFFKQMKGFVSKEVVDFLKFAQNAAKSCTKDYNAISEEAFIYAKVTLLKDWFTT